MSGLRTPSRTPSLASVNNTDSQNNAALLGATKAFGRPAPKARAPSNTYAGTNGALAAATRVGVTPSPKHAVASSPEEPAAPSTPPASNGSVNNATKRTPVLDHTTTPSLAVPRQRRERSISPSHQAARLAAARSPDTYATSVVTRPRANTSQKPSVAPKPRRLSDHYSKVREQKAGSPTDLSSIEPTTSLVELFERKSSNPASPSVGMRPSPITIRPSHDLPMRSPKPVRTSDGGITSVFQMELGESKAVLKPAASIAANDHEPKAQYKEQSSSDEYVSASEDAALASSPITIRKRASRAPSVSSMETGSIASPDGRRPRPSQSPLRHSSTQPLQIPKPPSRNLTSPVNMPSVSSQSGRSIPAQYHMLHPRRMTPLNTGDDLANAIVASSLASSRASSPRKIDPPPVPTRRQKQHKLSFSRTPSPTKYGMRHTLRKEESEEADTEDEHHPYGKHKKKRIVRKHPNKHHEGDRKRWRDAVTERERKRYEGVWAANKGMHCNFTLEEEQRFSRAPTAEATVAKRAAALEQVSNIVTRDIWARSRLPDVVLETVWDLVDSECIGRLNKEEFVVGMWLVDQRLKGRKLPARVSDSVSQSVRGLQGIKIRKHLHKR